LRVTLRPAFDSSAPRSHLDAEKPRATMSSASICRRLAAFVKFNFFGNGNEVAWLAKLHTTQHIAMRAFNNSRWASPLPLNSSLSLTNLTKCMQSYAKNSHSIRKCGECENYALNAK
jgi:hypothetical protein